MATKTLGRFLVGEEYRKGRIYGVEVELEYARALRLAYFENRPPVEQWSATEDGSLRDGGLELVSEPLTLRSMILRTEQLYEFIEPRMCTRRTGIHVHANVQDLTAQQVLVLFAAYSLIEPLLFDAVGGEREFSNYCLPWYDCRAEFEALWTRVLKRRDPTAELMNIARRSCKYMALNLGSLSQHGTVEFRHAPTFSEVDELHNWLNVVDQLVRTSLEFKSHDDVLALAETEPGEFLSIVLHGYNPAALPDYMDRMTECDTVGVLRRAVRGKPSYKPKGCDGEWEFGELEPVDAVPVPEEVEEEPDMFAQTTTATVRLRADVRRLEDIAVAEPIEDEIPFDEE